MNEYLVVAHSPYNSANQYSAKVVTSTNIPSAVYTSGYMASEVIRVEKMVR